MYDETKGGLKAQLRKIAKGISQKAALILPLPRLIQQSRQQILLPFYHIVRDDACPYIDPLYQIRSIKQFCADLEYLLQYFEPIDISQLIKICKGEISAPQKPVMHLSFDDGLRECAEIVAPILLQKGIPASFFVNPAFIDNHALMFRYKAALIYTQFLALAPQKQMNFLKKSGLKEIAETLSLGYDHQELLADFATLLDLDFDAALKTYQPDMSKGQLEGLLEQGFSLGSHSIDHPLYKNISLAEQLKQTIEGHRQLEALVDLPYRIFAFPFTDHNVSMDFFKQLLEKDYFDLTFGGAGIKLDSVERNLQRLPMESKVIEQVDSLVKTDYFYFLLKRMLGKHKIYRF